MCAWLCVSVCEGPNAHVDAEAHVCLIMQGIFFIMWVSLIKIRSSGLVAGETFHQPHFKNNFIRMFWCKLNEIFIFLRIVMNWNFLLSGGLLTEMNTLVLERSREQHVLPSFSLQTQQTATTQAFSLQSCCLFLTL